MKKLRERLRSMLIKLKPQLMNAVWGYNINATARVSFSAYLDKTHPEGIFIGADTLIARGAMILSHDFTRSLKEKTEVGSHCLIGANSIIMPGVTIGDHVVVGAGAIVTRDVPSNVVVAGNPAVVIRSISTGPYGKIYADAEI